MRYFKNNSGTVFCYPDHHMAHDELNDKIATAIEALELTSQYKERPDATNIDSPSQAAYESCSEYLELKRLKNIKIWIPDDAVEMTAVEIQAHLNPILKDERLAATARAQRDTLLEQFTWRYERHARETRLGVETTDALDALDAYAQALANVPQQKGFPTTIEWPLAP